MNTYMLLLVSDYKPNDDLSAEEKGKMMNKYLEWLNELKNKGIVKDGRPLASEGRVIKKETGLISDGPFSETKEIVGGYYLIEAPTLEEASAIAKTCPHIEMGGSIQVRPVMDI